MENNITETQQSRFNSGMAQIMRLSKLRDMGHTYALKKDWISYQSTLDRCWLELWANAEPEDIEKIKFIKKEIAKIQAIKTGHNEDLRNLWEQPKEIQEKVFEKRARLKTALEKYDVQLRKLENRQGLGTAYKDETDEDID